MTRILTTLALLLVINGTWGYTKPQCQGKRQVIVHLFEWRWPDIANECEAYLGPKGFCAVQVSPPNEHIQGEEWWVRYQPVSYLLESRSGNREQFIDMVNRCRAVGVNIYVDAVINHMSGMDRSGVGTGGSNFDGETQDYPDFDASHFHQPPCPVQSYTDFENVRNCYLVGLNDLDGSQSYVQDVQAKYMNDLINIGVAGFRVDASKHMWPKDLEAIQGKLNDVLDGGRPFIYHEVIDLSQSGEISVTEYYGVGQTTEFRYCIKISEGAKGFYGLPGVYDPGWGMSDPEHAFVFVDNHDNQRGHGAGNALTHKEPELYRFGQAFTLANDYGTKRVMSSYYFENTDAGPPKSSPGCGDEWVCEHRWKSIGQMVEFTNAVYGQPVDYKVTEGRTLAMSRGNVGFFAMGDLDRDFDTGMPDGDYCDIISECQQKITISGGRGHFKVYDPNEPVVAICQGCTGQGGGDEPNPSTPKPATSTSAKPQTTTSHESGPTTTTPKPQPGDKQRTIIFVYKETFPGSDVFIVGGQTDKSPIDIEIHPMPEDWESYNSWMEGDDQLDWDGPQPGQGLFNGYEAMGTALAWTTSDKTNPFYYELNPGLGDHYWILDVDIDCSQTQDGWFEFNTIYSIGGEDGEPTITQTDCSGEVGGTTSISGSVNHMAKCGFMNIFSYGKSTCQIDNLPVIR